MATGVLMGMGVLDEAWPSKPLMSMLRSLAFVLIVGGVCSLNCENIKQVARVTHVTHGTHGTSVALGTPATTRWW